MPYDGAKDGKHYWLTPPDLLERLKEEFDFDFDPCPYPRPDGFDGLTVEWGRSNYVNPPFNGPTKWARKAISEYRKGKKVIFVFPIDKWIHWMIEAASEIRNFGDVRWCSTESGIPGEGTGRHTACFVLDPEKKPPITGNQGELFGADPHAVRIQDEPGRSDESVERERG